MKEITLKEQKKIELDILDDFDSFCKKNRLNYYLAFGTLLGAVRHKGFIPWDDDIDICMFRKDYEKLINNFNKQTLGDSRLIWYGNTDGYHLSFAKIENKRTVIIENGADHLNIIQYGIYIDVFPLDFCSESKFKNTILSKKIKMISRLISCSITKSTKGYKNLKRIVYSIIRPFAILLGLEKMLIWKDVIAQKNKNTKYVDTISSSSRSNMYNIDWFKHGSKLLFEGKEYPVPKDWDSVLKKCYGNYMELPPLNERVPLHTFKTYWIETK